VLLATDARQGVRGGAARAAHAGTRLWCAHTRAGPVTDPGSLDPVVPAVARATSTAAGRLMVGERGCVCPSMSSGCSLSSSVP
jgi:hypothetical protein